MQHYNITFSYCLGDDLGTWHGQVEAENVPQAVNKARIALIAQFPGADPMMYNVVESDAEPTAKIQLVR